MNHTHPILERYREQEGKSIVDIIKDKLLLDFLGKKNAKKRRVLLSHCHRFDQSIPDREMRRIYNKVLPMGWCKEGIYVVDEIEEVDKAIETRERTIRAHEKAIEMLKIHRVYLKRRKKDEETRQEELPFPDGAF